MPVGPVLDTITSNREREREREREFLCAERKRVSVFLYETVVVCMCCVMYARIYISEHNCTQHRAVHGLLSLSTLSLHL